MLPTNAWTLLSSHDLCICETLINDILQRLTEVICPLSYAPND